MIDSTVYHIDHEPQLFVDDVLIESAQAVTRVWHKPQRFGDRPIIVRDQPWESSLYFTYSNYVVIADPADGKIKCWYEDVGPIDGKQHPWKTTVLYAESTDGVNFTKPFTGVKDKEGRETNICLGYQEGITPTDRNPWADCGVHSAGICIDPYPPTPDQRFRMIYSDSWLQDGKLKHKTRIAHSADGLTWKKYPFGASIGSTGGNLNDVSCIHYDHDARMFVQNTRDHRMYAVAAPPRTPSVAGWFPPVHPGRPDLMGRRRVVQTRSADFIHWTEPVLVSSPDDASGQAVCVDNLDVAHYGMQQFRVGRMHFATVGILRFVDNEMDVRLLYSRDGRTFTPADRGTPFLTPRGQGHWDAEMVSLTSQPVEIGDELYFYHGGSKAHHDWWAGPPEGIDHPDAKNPYEAMRDGFGLGLAKLRKDGFASLRAGKERPGYVLTKPFKSPGNRLTINARCNPGGSIRVGVLNPDRHALPDRDPEKSDPLTGDATAHEVTWSNNPDLGEPGKWRQLVFHLRDAELFSFTLPDAPASESPKSDILWQPDKLKAT